MESSLLLKFMPLLLEDIEGLAHLEFLKEVSNEIIDNHISFNYLRFRFLSESSH
jgi:hypothetical protein